MAKLLKPLTRTEQHILAWLVKNCNPKPGVIAFPSVRKQAEAMGDRTPQVVHKYRHRLAEKGWLTFNRKGLVSSITVSGMSANTNQLLDYTATPVTQAVEVKISPEEIYRP